MNNNETTERLLESCQLVADELERVGKPQCFDCIYCKKMPDDLGDRHYCEMLSDIDEDNPTENEYHEIDEDDGASCCPHYEHNNVRSTYGDMYAWLEEQLDTEYTICGNGNYKHGCVTTGTGGPHIEVDTRDRCVRGYLGNEKACVSVSQPVISELDEALEEMYEASR